MSTWLPVDTPFLIAEHPLAAKPGSCLVKKEHVAALWRLSVERSLQKPAPHLEVVARDAVATHSLDLYDEVLDLQEERLS